MTILSAVLFTTVVADDSFSMLQRARVRQASSSEGATNATAASRQFDLAQLQAIHEEMLPTSAEIVCKQTRLMEEIYESEELKKEWVHTWIASPADNSRLPASARSCGKVSYPDYFGGSTKLEIESGSVYKFFKVMADSGMFPNYGNEHCGGRRVDGSPPGSHRWGRPFVWHNPNVDRAMSDLANDQRTVYRDGRRTLVYLRWVHQEMVRLVGSLMAKAGLNPMADQAGYCYPAAFWFEPEDSRNWVGITAEEESESTLELKQETLDEIFDAGHIIRDQTNQIHHDIGQIYDEFRGYLKQIDDEIPQNQQSVGVSIGTEVAGQ